MIACYDCGRDTGGKYKRCDHCRALQRKRDIRYCVKHKEKINKKKVERRKLLKKQFRCIKCHRPLNIDTDIGYAQCTDCRTGRT